LQTGPSLFHVLVINTHRNPNEKLGEDGALRLASMAVVEDASVWGEEVHVAALEALLVVIVF
jgi:hypothetical protein